MRAPWWRPLVGLSAEHIRLVQREGLLEGLETRAQLYRAEAQKTEEPRVAKECMRRAAMLRETKVALDQAAEQ